MGKELLLEIGTEEIPAAFLPKALEISNLNTRGKSFLFMLADYFSLDRVKIGQC